VSERYEKTDLLGSGRAGEVYKAKDSVLGRHVALRRFPENELDVENLSEEWKDSFMGLICGLSGISHTNIMQMIDGGIDDEGPFLVSAFVEGKGLAELAYGDTDDFGAVDAYDLASQVLDALIVAESLGFNHYSMSPTSIIAQPKATGGYSYILTDLGHSKLLPMIFGGEEAVKKTQIPALMAPELYEEKPAGASTSLFILGQLIYWMLAKGHPYCDLSAEEVYHKYKEGKLDSILKYRMEVPKEFVSWLKRMIKPLPEDRFPSLEIALRAIPKAPKRFHAKKVNLPPKPISENDLGVSA